MGEMETWTMNRLDRLHWILLAVIGLLLLMDACLTVSPYRYFHLAAPHGLVRVNRFTGEGREAVGYRLEAYGTGTEPICFRGGTASRNPSI
jgi:hypothetical protein